MEYLSLQFYTMKLEKQQKQGKRQPRASSSFVNEFTFGWLGSVADLSLVLLSITCELNRAAFTHRKSTSKILEDAGRMFKALRSARLQRSLRSGLYQIADKGYRDQWKITDKGYEQLRHLVPKYLTERTWDGSFYLIVFDIPENLKRSRQKLRKTLADTGCGMLQESVWMSIGDPELAIADIREWDELEDYILILKTDRDHSRTSAQLLPLVAQAFKLTPLNLRYRGFLDRVRTGDQTPMELALLYLGILKDDPQLPFDLLSKSWAGDAAFRTYKEQIIPKLPHQQSAFIDALLLQG